jgi:hypothetical protein
MCQNVKDISYIHCHQPQEVSLGSSLRVVYHDGPNVIECVKRHADVDATGMSSSNNNLNYDMGALVMSSSPSQHPQPPRPHPKRREEGLACPDESGLDLVRLEEGLL